MGSDGGPTSPPLGGFHRRGHGDEDSHEAGVVGVHGSWYTVRPDLARNGRDPVGVCDIAESWFAGAGCIGVRARGVKAVRGCFGAVLTVTGCRGAA